ncbi:hypothetical protein MKW92_046413 [Papaver armeniacum]|nr:hypothetical protein MKW92_046413 [Papaver armeniacum]
MSDLVARTGRHQQRYQDGCRLVAGCIPFKYREDDSGDSNCKKIVEVLMINSSSGPGLLFPKVEQILVSVLLSMLLKTSGVITTLLGGWENDETVEEAAAREALEEAGVRGVMMKNLGHYKFKSKTHQDEFSPEGLCKAAMFALLVKEQLNSWPEQSTRVRTWLTIPEAAKIVDILGCGKYSRKLSPNGMLATC